MLKLEETIDKLPSPERLFLIRNFAHPGVDANAGWTFAAY